MRSNKIQHHLPLGNAGVKHTRKAAKQIRQSLYRQPRAQHRGHSYSKQATGNTPTLVSCLLLFMIAGAAVADTSQTIQTQTRSIKRVSSGSAPLNSLGQRIPVGLTDKPKTTCNSTLIEQHALESLSNTMEIPIGESYISAIGQLPPLTYAPIYVATPPPVASMKVSPEENIYKFIREGRVHKSAEILNAHPQLISSLANHELFITEEDIQACIAISDLDSIDLDQVFWGEHGPIVVQNGCRAMVRLKSGQVLNLEGTDASDLRNFLVQKKYPETTPEDIKADGVLSLFISPKHGFTHIECASCDAGGPFSDVRGFNTRNERLVEAWLPLGSMRRALGKYERIANTLRDFHLLLWSQRASVDSEVWYQKKSDDENHLKIQVLVGKGQARAILDEVRLVEKACRENDTNDCFYHVATNNCVQFSQRLFEQTGDKAEFGDFLTDLQFQDGHLSSPADLIGLYRAMDYSFLRSRPMSYVAANLGIKELMGLSDSTLAKPGPRSPSYAAIASEYMNLLENFQVYKQAVLEALSLAESTTENVEGFYPRVQGPVSMSDLKQGLFYFGLITILACTFHKRRQAV